MDPDQSFAQRLTIVNSRGLHARASARFVRTAEAFDAEVLVSRDGMEVDGTSILDLMMLAAAPGASILVRTSGNEARAALDALSELVSSGFGEDRGDAAND